MRKAFIVHGWGGSPKEPLHQWIKKNLEEKKFEIIAPLMPNPDEPKIKVWVGKLKDITKNLDKKDIFIGHSIGCQAIMRYLETLNRDVRVDKVIFIAPWITLQGIDQEEGAEEIAKPWVETPINFNEVRKHCDKFFCIFSSNDPYVNLSNKDKFEKHLNAKTIVVKNKGHFDYDSKVDSLPEILDFIN